MEIIALFVIAIVTVVAAAVCALCTPIKKQNSNYKQTNRKNIKKYDDEESDEDFWNEIAEMKSTMNTLYGGYSLGGKSSKEKRIERKRKEVAELEKEHHWERNYDPAWDTESYTSNNWDSEETKFDKQIGNLKQQNVSYGNWMEYEDRRTYKDESDPTEFSEDDK